MRLFIIKVKVSAFVYTQPLPSKNKPHNYI
jgi:hypothetical protein